MLKKKKDHKTDASRAQSEPCKKLAVKKVGTRQLSNDELKLVAGATPNWGHHGYH